MHKLLKLGVLFFCSTPFAAAGCGSSTDSRVGQTSLDGGADASVFMPPATTGSPTSSPTTAPTSTSSTGTCNPDFCPAMGAGEPCCVSAGGPCGMDVGMGCVQMLPGADGG